MPVVNQSCCNNDVYIALLCILPYSGPSVDYLVRLNTPGVIGLVVGVLVVMVLVYTCGLLTGSLVQRQRGGAGKCPLNLAPDTAAVQLPPVYEQVLPPATTSTSIPLEENVAYATKLQN